MAQSQCGLLPCSKTEPRRVLLSEGQSASLPTVLGWQKTPRITSPWRGFPEDEEFIRYLQQWLISPTSEDCPLGGQASFGTAISLNDAQDDVVASHFRTFLDPLKTQADFINAFDATHRIADDISRKTGASVFPYSMFFVFFDQYAHIISITQQVLGLGLASILVVTALFLGSWRTGLIVTAVVALTVVNVMGVMGLWGRQSERSSALSISSYP